MKYEVQVHFAPSFELLLSFLLFKRTDHVKYLDVGKDWVTTLSKNIPAEILNEMEQLEDLSFFDASTLLIEKASNIEPVEDYLHRISTYSPGEMYEMIAPHLLPEQPISQDLGAKRDEYVRILSNWNTYYFTKLGHHVVSMLHSSYQDVSSLVGTMSNMELIEEVTNGLLVTSDFPKVVKLVPTFHFRPYHTLGISKDTLHIWYPLKKGHKEQIISIGKAISDERRLNILKLLSTGTYSFTDIVKEIGSAKGNIHHHIMVLRATGLLNIHLDSNCSSNYTFSLRAKRLENLYGDFLTLLNNKR